jgi:methyl-accepting chemotaxis protein
LSGRAWDRQELFFVEDIGEMADCCRAPVAKRDGVKSGVCFPILVQGQFVGTMDFFALETLTLSAPRMEALRSVADLVSGAFARVAELERQAELAANTGAVNTVLSALAAADTGEAAARAALDAVRDAFGWAYGSYWKLDPAQNALAFAVESGSVNPDFRRVTLEARFPEGVGLSGRAWQRRELVFVEDIGQVHDCCRAPVAQRAGVKSGVCFPVEVAGRVVGTMDFFALETLELSTDRLDSLRSVGRMVSQAMERITQEETLREKVALMLDVVRAARDGDLTRDVTVTGDDAIGQMGDGLRDFMQELRTALAGVGEAAAQVNSAAGQVSASSQSLAEGSSRQAAAMEECSASLEQLTAMTANNAENAHAASVLAAEASSSAEQGDLAMRDMTEVISKIKESADKTAKIVKTIDEIAFQTNLLALNAAVEAARSGDAGRGFAVVAEEVRNLASRSAEAARNTAELIEESVSRANGGVKVADDVASCLGRIRENAHKVSNIIDEIAKSSKEQANGLAQINTAVLDVDQVTQQNASVSEEAAAASEELSSQAESMQSLVARFRVGNEADAAYDYAAYPAPRSLAAPGGRPHAQAQRGLPAPGGRVYRG